MPQPLFAAVQNKTDETTGHTVSGSDTALI